MASAGSGLSRALIRSIGTIRACGSRLADRAEYSGGTPVEPPQPRSLVSAARLVRWRRKPRKPSMAKTSDVAADAAVPSSANIERAAAFAREPFLLDGEGPEALAPGTARRRALDAALKELDEGAENPSIQWRRDFSLLLGLERFLADEPPKLRDGAELNPHQVDALSG